jgi:hypothetical protein
MRRILASVSVALCLVFPPLTVFAQESAEAHPLLNAKFTLGLGAFSPQKQFKIRVDGSSPSEEIDFDEVLGFDDSEITGAMSFRWRFGEKWSITGQHWAVDSQGGAVLIEDVEWNDIVFKEGTFANAGLKTTVTRVFFGRTFKTGPNYEFGLGAGLHWMEWNAFIEGEVIVNEDTTEFQRGAVDAAVPLPNFGGWYMYSWSPKWIATAGVDWLSVSFGDYSGGLWNARAGINYQAFKHIGIGLSYNNFTLDVDVDKSDWHGRLETRQQGPRLEFTATW